MAVFRLIDFNNRDNETENQKIIYEKELLNSYLQIACKKYSSRYYKSKFNSVMQHFIPWIRQRGLFIWDVTPSEFDGFSISLQNELKKTTSHGYCSMIYSFYGWLISRKSDEIYNKYKVRIINPVDEWNKPSKKRAEDDLPPLPDSEVVHFFIQAMKKELHDAILNEDARESILFSRRIVTTSIMLQAGLRVSEVAALNVSDIMFKEMIIIVRNGKGNKDRIVDLSSDLGKLLKWYLKEAHPFVLHNKKIVPTTPLILSEQDKRISDITLKSEMRILQEKYNLPIDQFFSPHGLRRLFATNLYKTLISESHPDPLTYIKIQLGHVFYSTTLRYCRIETAITSRSNNLAIDAVKRKLLGGANDDNNMELNTCDV